MDNLRVAMPDHPESAKHEVSQGDIAPPKSAPVLELNEMLSSLNNFCLDKRELNIGELSMSGPGFRHFGFDDRRQSVNTFEVFLVEIGLHQLDAEMPLNLQNELEYVDGIDFQFSAEQRLDRPLDPRGLGR